MKLCLLASLIGCTAALQLNAIPTSLNAVPTGTARDASLRAAVAAVRMDDIPMTKPASSDVVESNRANFACSFEIPKKGISEYGTVNMNFKPILATDSELVMATYNLPFGLTAEPKGRVVVVTKDGEQERVGDILRFTLQWNQNQPAMFDVCKCMERQLQGSFDEVVKALVSNDGTYADEIVMIFERPLE